MCHTFSTKSRNVASRLRCLHYLDRRAENITTMSLCVTPLIPNPVIFPPGLGACIILIGELKISNQWHYVSHIQYQILECCLTQLRCLPYLDRSVENIYYMSQCQNSSKFLSVSYLMKTADLIMNFFSSHNTTDHT